MTILLYDLVGADLARPFSPHCWKVAMALAHKGLAFDRVPTPFTAVPSIEAGVSRTVPVIRDGDRVVADSFEIAVYLEKAYPDAPTLFGGDGGVAMARFVERWSQATIHPFFGAAAMAEIHDRLAQDDQAYFRRSREERNNGRSLESVAAERDVRQPEFIKKLEPLRSMLSFQPFIGGSQPLFCDHIVFGAFQWMRIMSTYAPIPPEDPVSGWFERCLDLYSGFGRSIGPASRPGAPA